MKILMLYTSAGRWLGYFHTERELNDWLTEIDPLCKKYPEVKILPYEVPKDSEGKLLWW